MLDSVFLVVTQIIIFLSYVVISSILAYLYIRHRRYIDTCVNRLLLVTAGLFLMLCAVTHLVLIWSHTPSEPLYFVLALVSLIAAVCTVLTSSGLDDYLRRRMSTLEVMREDIVANLTKGYDLKVTVSGNRIVGGVAGPVEISNPLHIDEGFTMNGIVRVGENYFRIVHIVNPFVGVEQPEHTGQAEQRRMSVSETTQQVFGYDATAEVHMKQESERLNRIKMELCMSTAHHVRTPLSCLGVALTCLQSEVGSSLLDEVFVQYEIIDLVVRQFVDIATIESTTLCMRPRKERVNVRHLVCRVEKVLTSVCAEEVLSKCVVGPGVPHFVLTDGEWLLQIMLNIVTYAASYTNAGRIDVDVSLLPPMNLSIVVTDTALNYDAFDKDFTNDTTGIGLYSVKKKVDALCGKYEIVGASLSVVIPVEIELNAGCYDPKNNFCARSVLVVDDTPSVRKIMQRFLKDHVVEVAVDGADGLQKMTQKRYDIVFLDMMMPVLDGEQCLTQFRQWESVNRREENRQIVYCMSATNVELSNYFDGSIPKPVDTKRLNSLLRYLR